MEDDLKELFGLNEDDSQEDFVDPQEDDEATDEGTEEEVEETEESVEEVATPQQQSQEANHIAAQARRQAEEKLREQEEKTNKATKELDVVLKALEEFGYAGTPEEIADNLRASKSGQTVEEVRTKRLEEERKLQEQIDNHPEVKAARQQIEEVEKEKTRRMFEDELRNIQKMNPEIKSLDDLRKLGDDQELFDTLIRGGMHIDTAYKHIMHDKAPNKPQPSTKSHMKTVNGSSYEGNNSIVPREERELIKMMMPGISDKEINAWYRKNH